MIIQCEKCKTRFNLDDSRVTDKGVKVRCTKCKHVFRVQKEEQGAESCEPEGVVPGFTFPAAGSEEPAVTSVDRPVAAEKAPEAPFGLEDLETSPFDTSAISFESDDENETDTAVEPSAKGGEVDFSNFDFGDGDSESDLNSPSALSADDFTAAPDEPAAEVSQKQVSQGLDFSDDDIFGAVVQSAPEVSNETISFDFEGDSFAESMQMGGQDSRGKSGTLFSLDTPGDAPFNLGEIDFGDELTSVAVQQVNPDDLKPSQEILFAPLAEAQDKAADDDLKRSFLGGAPTVGEQELPPLSIASRRKRSPLFSVLITITALLVISVLGYMVYSSFYGRSDSALPETGKISVRAVKADFIKNSSVGELLVVSGEALNEYPKPRAALQVKVTVFDAAGQIIATKSAYGGNPMTEEQMASLPLDQIEAAMANQFGDSLANMEVAPGKAIPFVVVVANLPEGAKDFVVQSAGSTVATGKQQ